MWIFSGETRATSSISIPPSAESISTGRAVARSGLSHVPRHKSFFMHMPKCGGTSVSEAMYATVPITRRVAVIDAVSTRRAAAIWYENVDDPQLFHEDLSEAARLFEMREQMLLQHMAWGSWLIHGHVLYSERAYRHFFKDYKYVTLLRDPAERMISNYWMAERAGVVPLDFDAYLETGAARSHAQVYLRYLGGQTVVPDCEMSRVTARAEERLKRFDLVGFLDDLHGFRQNYRALFGTSLAIGVANAAPVKPPSLTAAQRARIDAMTGPDRALYDLARAEFGRAEPARLRA